MPDLLIFIIGQVFTAGAIYGGIRADIKGAVREAEIAAAAAHDAHKRIDLLIMNR